MTRKIILRNDHLNLVERVQGKRRPVVLSRTQVTVPNTYRLPKAGKIRVTQYQIDNQPLTLAGKSGRI